MPVDIPTLAEVNGSHFFGVDFRAGECFDRVFDILVHLKHRCKVHEVTSIYRDICSKGLISAVEPSAFLAPVLNVINYQTAIMNDLRQSTAEVYVFISLEVFKVLAAETSCHYQTKHWSPSFTAPVQQVICRIMQTLYVQQHTLLYDSNDSLTLLTALISASI